jgi:hypothetical protein
LRGYLDFVHNELTVREGKGKKERSIPLMPELKTDIEQVLREKKSFTLRCMLDCIKELQGRVATWNRCASSVSII